MEGIISQTLNDPIVAAIQSKLGTNNAIRLYDAVRNFSRLVESADEILFENDALYGTIDSLTTECAK
jgi:hypothetical protein